MQQTPKAPSLSGTDTRTGTQNGSGLTPSATAGVDLSDTTPGRNAGLGASAHNVIQKVTESAHPAVDRLASTAHQTLDKLASAADTTVDTLGKRGAQLLETQGRMAEACRGYVRNNPLAAVGIAAAAGFLVYHLTAAKRLPRGD